MGKSSKALLKSHERSEFSWMQEEFDMGDMLLPFQKTAIEVYFPSRLLGDLHERSGKLI